MGHILGRVHDTAPYAQTGGCGIAAKPLGGERSPHHPGRPPMTLLGAGQSRRAAGSHLTAWQVFREKAGNATAPSLTAARQLDVIAPGCNDTQSRGLRPWRAAWLGEERRAE